MAFDPTEEEVNTLTARDIVNRMKDMNKSNSVEGYGHKPTHIKALDKPHPEDRNENINGGVFDAGLHYRKEYKGIKLDPFRIAKVYNLDGVQLTILKKTLVTGDRGAKDATQDYKDIINAATRAIEMIEEDET